MKINYRNSKGKRLPSVTTILKNLGWNRDALMYWSWNEGMEGRDYKESAKLAADVGTVSHGWIEADIKREKFDISEFEELNADQQIQVQNCHKAFEDWKGYTQLELIEAEISLISEDQQFAGTIDSVGTIRNQTCIVDLKTGTNIYEDHILQLAGYAILWRENRKEKIDSIHILRVGKNDGSFTHRMIPIQSMQPAFEVFSELLKIHYLKRKMSKLK